LGGKVESYSDDSVSVTLENESYEVLIPNPTYLQCLVKIARSVQGAEVELSKTLIDYSKMENKGTLLSLTQISEIILVGDDINIWAQVNGKDILTAHVIIGFGCEADRTFNLKQ